MGDCSLNDAVSEHQYLPFEEFPIDVQLNIISFLTPPDLFSLSFTSKRLLSLSSPSSRSWHSIIHRNWGAHTDIPSWGVPPTKTLFDTLSLCHNLIGFWRPIGNTPPFNLIHFQWGADSVTGSHVGPSKDGGFKVTRVPFMGVRVNEGGERESWVEDEEGRRVRVRVGFMGVNHVIIEESKGYDGKCGGESEGGGGEGREYYERVANRRSSGGGRRQRRREKERQQLFQVLDKRGGVCGWWGGGEPLHFVKIGLSEPSPARPLQGLWKGFCENMQLDFYLVTYDDVGGVTCRRVGDCSKPLSVYAPVFWAANASLIESPLSREEDYLYNTRMHLLPVAESLDDTCERSPSHIMYINSSCDLVVPDSAGTSVTPRNVEGRIWRYVDGTFGFGFLRDNFIVDLKHIAKNGYLLDVAELCSI